MSSRHIVLAGDSIFDNDVYVPDGPGVLQQMRDAIPDEWSAYKIAVDGDCISDVMRQTKNLPSGTTDLILSVGGNDALGYSDLLREVGSLGDLERVLREPVAEFSADYGALLDLLAPLPPRLRVCTIYTAIPFAEALFRAFAPTAIAAFNGAIMGEAAKRGVPVVRLDLVCTEPDDYSALSPIEPSVKGGQKIVDALLMDLSR